MKNNGANYAPVVILEEFLVAEELAGLLQFVHHHRKDFTDTSIVGAKGDSKVDLDYRRSRVLYDIGRYRDVFVDRILAHLPRVLSGLDHPKFRATEVEVQLTSTAHAGFFRKHNDNGADLLHGRRVTFVYFFHREPKPFVGGEFCIYGRNGANGQGLRARITPAQNQMLFFISDYLHEVLPVQCVSNDLRDSRFTVNGWIHS
jgi:Rps23 Pro-64 3,4-dihydroxylase Tpa1-like proline 4-hydroxylase